MEAYQQVLGFDITMANTNAIMDMCQWSTYLYPKAKEPISISSSYADWAQFCPNYKPNLQLDIFKPCITHYPPKLDRADLSCGSEPLPIACRHRNLQEQQVDDPGKWKAKFFSIPGRCRVSHTPGACAGSCDCSAWQFGKLFQGRIQGPSWGKAHPSLW